MENQPDTTPPTAPQAAPPPPSQPVPPSPPPKHNSGILIGIFLLLLGILVGLALSKTTILSGLHIPYVSVTPTPIPTSLPAPTPTPDPTANWKTYTSPCGFLVKYPEGWKGQQYFIQDEKSKDTSCAFLTAPDYTQGLDSRTGFSIEFSKIIKGTINMGITVNTVDDYIKSIEAMVQPSTLVKNKTTKIYGTIEGTQFDFDAFESTTTFVFTYRNYLWIINWPTITQYTGAFRTSLDQILSTFKFLDQTTTPPTGQRVDCPANAGGQICPMICIQPPPYICGSNGKSYCSECQACSNAGVSWYVTQDTPCTTQ